MFTTTLRCSNWQHRKKLKCHPYFFLVIPSISSEMLNEETSNKNKIVAMTLRGTNWQHRKRVKCHLNVKPSVSAQTSPWRNRN